jgi:type II secretion system protein C
MQLNNIKYHALNTVTMLIFSYVTAASVNHILRYALSPGIPQKTQQQRKQAPQKSVKSFEEYAPLVQSGFFKIASESAEGDNAPQATAADDLMLVGTITGPPAIALAMIKKKSEQDPKIFALIKKSDQITNDVYGYKLIAISDKYVRLRLNDDVRVLHLYEKPVEQKAPVEAGSPEPGGNVVNKKLSRAEMQQKVLNNMDNALKGMTAGPHRVDNVIVGYRLIRIQPYNILYQYGARTGDIIKRVNGHSLDSTEKLYRMWEMIKTESKIRIDLERKGQIMTFEFNITD